MKRFYNIYGHALQTQNKTAQQTTDEIHGMDSTSWIIPLERLECRKKMVEEINDLFGTKMTVDFSPAWKLQFEKFKSDSSLYTMHKVTSIIAKYKDFSNNEITIEYTKDNEKYPIVYDETTKYVSFYPEFFTGWQRKFVILKMIREWLLHQLTYKILNFLCFILLFLSL